MKRKSFLLLAALLLAFLVSACGQGIETSTIETPTGISEPDLGWLFLEQGPYTMTTHVNAAPGPANVKLVADLSLMDSQPEIVLERNALITPDSMLTVRFGDLKPGFYEVRLRDSIRWNIGVRPDAVVSEPDPQPDFWDFWTQTLAEMDQIPLEAVYTKIPAYSNKDRICYEIRYPSWGGAISGGILSVPVAPGKYPVYLQYMGYGAEPFYFDPSASPDRIDYLVSIRDQGIFRDTLFRWIDRDWPPRRRSTTAAPSPTPSGLSISWPRSTRPIPTASCRWARARAAP